MDKFLGFQGRIGRGRWWLGIFTLFILLVVIKFGLFYAFNVPVSKIANGLQFGSDPTRIVIDFICLIALVYPSLSLHAKRLNDRNRPTGLVWILLIPFVVGQLSWIVSAPTEVAEIAGVQVPKLSLFDWILTGVDLVILIWAVVDLGILRGTRGPNRNGPDPLEK